MKKLISILLAIVMLASISTVAFAEGSANTYKENGITLHYTDMFKNTKGVFYPYPGGYDYDTGLGVLVFWYLAMPQKEADVFFSKNDSDWTEADKAYFETRHGELLEVISVGGGRSLSDLLKTEPDLELSEDYFTEVGKAGDVTFYAMMIPEMSELFLDGIDPVYQEEFKALQKELMKVLKNGEYFKPVVEGSELIGKCLSFETRDVDGNTVKSEDIFKKNDITMINVWATWCGNCINELTELSEMSERLAGKEVAVIGICADADSELAACKKIIGEHGVKYMNLLPFEGMDETLGLTAYPMSYFVGSDGTVLCLPFKGAPMDMSAYEEIIEKLLAGETIDQEGTGAQVANDAGVYRVIVSDEKGNPVEGAMVQFCSDSTCTMGKTDKNGIAEFETEEGHYTVHILKVPEGYQKTSEEIHTDAVYSDVHFVLKHA